MSAIEPFRISIAESALEDLRMRLAHARWPERETVTDWTQGVPLAEMRALCEHWRNEYDWRRCEAELNAHGNYMTMIDGLDIHFLHVRSPNPDALPLLITHGWPGSVLEFLKVIGPLSDPAANGGDPDDAFHLIIPSLPGFGFSAKPAETGWNAKRIAHAWIALMGRLGYDRWVAQGGDIGARVSTVLGQMRPAGLLAIHTNMPMARPDIENAANWNDEESSIAEAMEFMFKDGLGYYMIQQTRPQTLGYGLSDSPVGQAAWIYEKFRAWSDCGGDPETVFTRDEMLDHISLYWLTQSAASSARIYWESADPESWAPSPVDLPTGATKFPGEVLKTTRRWVERTYRNLVYWNEAERGGHFAAFEQPEIFTQELRACFRPFR